MSRAPPARAGCCCAPTAIELPFADESFDAVLLVAVLEHTREPWRLLAEARRVLKPGGRVVMVVPNDVTMSAGRLLLAQFPIRYPDHLTFTTPRTDARAGCADGSGSSRRFTLPFRALPFAVNLYYFVVAEKASAGEGASACRPIRS